jgi:hypothetical protein
MPAVGQRIGIVSVLSVGYRFKDHAAVLVGCDCGYVALLRLDTLWQSRRASCGCETQILQREFLGPIPKTLAAHVYATSLRKPNPWMELEGAYDHDPVPSSFAVAPGAAPFGQMLPGTVRWEAYRLSSIDFDPEWWDKET